jgi:ABC-2 type transport system ATP-binding protein
MTAILVEELSKTFSVRGKRASLFRPRPKQDVVAVRDLSFAIQPGERVAFIGPNGAGKSTTLKMLTGLLQPSGGHAEVAGHVPWRQRRQLAHCIGILFGQRSQLWYHLPVRDSLTLIGRIYGLDRARIAQRIAHLAGVLMIGDLLDRTTAQLSLGQRLRCEIAAALLHNPPILLLDEPTIGLDVTAKAALRDHLIALSDAEGTTILLTSHDTGDIGRICARAIVIDRGAKLLDQPLETLRQAHLRRRTVTLVTEEERPQLDLPGVSIVESEPHRLSLAVDTDRIAVDRVVATALERLSVRDLMIEHPPLDEVIRAIYAAAPAS